MLWQNGVEVHRVSVICYKWCGRFARQPDGTFKAEERKNEHKFMTDQSLQKWREKQIDKEIDVGTVDLEFDWDPEYDEQQDEAPRVLDSVGSWSVSCAGSWNRR